VLDPFKQAGAVGVILSWEGVSDENAEGQYAPFGKKFADLPCLWVGEKTGEELRQLAAAGGQATITLEATITPDAPTDTVYGILPGGSEEIILVHTHSDGPNAVEENAGIGVAALAKYLAALPKGDAEADLSIQHDDRPHGVLPDGTFVARVRGQTPRSRQTDGRRSYT
jgi:hypothetical protein